MQIDINWVILTPCPAYQVLQKLLIGASKNDHFSCFPIPCQTGLSFVICDTYDLKISKLNLHVYCNTWWFFPLLVVRGRKPRNFWSLSEQSIHTKKQKEGLDKAESFLQQWKISILSILRISLVYLDKSIKGILLYTRPARPGTGPPVHIGIWGLVPTKFW